MPKIANPVRRARATRKTGKKSRSASTKVVPTNLEAWLAGFHAGVCDRPNEPPRKTDRAAWDAGYLEGYAHMRAGKILHNAKVETGDFNLGGDYCSVGKVAWTSGFRVGLRYAARRAWC